MTTEETHEDDEHAGLFESEGDEDKDEADDGA